MLNTRFFLSVLAYFAAGFTIGMLWHEVIFKSMYTAFNVYSNGENPVIAYLIIGTLIEGTVLTLLFQRFAPATGRVQFGIYLGVMLCLFASSYDAFLVAATSNISGAGSVTFLVLELISMVLYGIAGGAAVGWVNRNM